jgi:PAS domain S-box-containing protein
MMHTDKTYDELQIELNELRKSYELLKSKCEHALSDLSKAEENARFSDNKFKIAFLTSPDSVNINRLSDGMYVSVNEGFIKMLGFNEDEVIGKTSLELNIWDNPENRKQLVGILQENGKAENFEAIFRHKDGRRVIGLMSASIIDLEGVPHSLNITKDITSRKQVEEALFREQFLVNALFDTIPDHIYFKDLDSRFIRNSKSHILSFGYSNSEDVKGKTDFDFFKKEDAQKAFDDEQTIIRNGQGIIKEEKLTRINQSDVWFTAMKLPLCDKEGNIIGTFGISRDITSNKKAEEELESERIMLRTLIDNMPDRIYAKDLNSRFIVSNKSLINRLGKSDKSEIIGKSDFDLMSHDQAEIYYKNEQEVIRTGVPLINHEESMVIASGQRKWSLTSKVPLYDNKGSIIGIVGMGRDITELKRKEIEAQVLFEITEGITITDNLDELLKLIHLSLAKVVYAENCFVALHDNKSGLFSFPYFVDKIDPTPEPTLMGKSCTAYVFSTNEPLLLTQEKFDMLSSRNEVELVGSNSPSWIGVPLNTPSSTIGVMVLQHYEKDNVYSETDLKFLSSVGSQIAIAIDRKRSEEEIRLKNELLQALNLEKDKFFSILAHDLRGPLSAFVAATEILADEIGSMSLVEIQEITAAMKKSATSIYGLLENLLEWSRLRRGGMNFIPQQISLKDAAIGCTKVLSESAVKKNIELIVSIPDDIEVLADIHMLDSVFRNLVSNAIKFTKTGGKVNIEGTRKNDNSVEVKIIDSGIGMAPDLVSRLFQINEKTSRPGTDGEVSTGLGLLLCKEFIEKHNGTLVVESEVGSGTTFTFWLPNK